MFDKDPMNLSIVTLILMFVLSSWGGTVNYLTRIKRGDVKIFSIIEWVGEMCISSFSGLLVGMIAINYKLDNLIVFAMVGIAGHAGGRTVLYLETVFNQRLDSLTKNIVSKKNND